MEGYKPFSMDNTFGMHGEEKFFFVLLSLPTLREHSVTMLWHTAVQSNNIVLGHLIAQEGRSQLASLHSLVHRLEYKRGHLLSIMRPR